MLRLRLGQTPWGFPRCVSTGNQCWWFAMKILLVGLMEGFLAKKPSRPIPALIGRHVYRRTYMWIQILNIRKNAGGKHICNICACINWFHLHAILHMEIRTEIDNSYSSSLQPWRTLCARWKSTRWKAESSRFKWPQATQWKIWRRCFVNRSSVKIQSSERSSKQKCWEPMEKCSKMMVPLQACWMLNLKYLLFTLEMKLKLQQNRQSM